MPDAGSPRQTQSYLMRRFAEAGLRPQIQHGQNFLIDLNLLRVLAGAARLDRRDVVLEVGTGLGSLTALLAERAAAVVTVEIDPHLAVLAAESLFNVPNVTLLRLDALRNKSTLDARVLEAVDARLAEAPGRRFKLAANLPYNLATPLISNLLALEAPPVSMTVTIQKELADRAMASPGTKDYSALSAWVQSQCRIELVRVMPPTVFWPRPKVQSAIVHLEVDAAMRGRIHDRAFFHRFVRSLFLHRRKYLRGVLHSAFKDQIGKPDADAILAALHIGPTARAEELSVETLLELSRVVQERLGGAG